MAAKQAGLERCGDRGEPLDVFDDHGAVAELEPAVGDCHHWIGSITKRLVTHHVSPHHADQANHKQRADGVLPSGNYQHDEQDQSGCREETFTEAIASFTNLVLIHSSFPDHTLGHDERFTRFQSASGGDAD